MAKPDPIKHARQIGAFWGALAVGISKILARFVALCIYFRINSPVMPYAMLWKVAVRQSLSGFIWGAILGAVAGEASYLWHVRDSRGRQYCLRWGIAALLINGGWLLAATAFRWRLHVYLGSTVEYELMYLLLSILSNTSLQASLLMVLAGTVMPHEGRGSVQITEKIRL